VIRPVGAGLAPSQGAQASAGSLLSFEDEPSQGAGADDATQNENVLKRKKRRQRHH
jgi:hypothetical protein